MACKFCLDGVSRLRQAVRSLLCMFVPEPSIMTDQPIWPAWIQTVARADRGPDFSHLRAQRGSNYLLSARADLQQLCVVPWWCHPSCCLSCRVLAGRVVEDGVHRSVRHMCACMRILCLASIHPPPWVCCFLGLLFLGSAVSWVCCLIADDISPEMRKFPHRKYAIMGALDTCFNLLATW